MTAKQKSGVLKAKFNSLAINENDPTILKGTVIVHDFEESWNGQVITEEVCQENMSTLIGKRIVCKYINAEDNNGADALTDHEETLGKNRDGEDIVITDTIAVGFIEDVYIGDFTDSSGNTKRVLYANIVLWNDDKYANIVGLLKEWLDRGVLIHMSVEYLYMNYTVTNGVEYLQSPIVYVAHTLLNSEDRGEYAEISPAYDVAQLLSLNEKKSWNKAVNQCISKNNKNNKQLNNKEVTEVMENLFFKSLNELSHGDIRSQIMEVLSKTMTADEFSYVWVSSWGVYDTYFVYENYEGGKYVNYKVPYVKNETQVTVDLANKVLVERDTVRVEVAQLAEVQTSLNTKITELETANTTISELEKSLNSAKETIKTLESEKDGVVEKFNGASDTVVSLNSKVEELTSKVSEMQPLIDKYNEEQFKKALNSAKEDYKAKFEGVGAIEIFEKDETLELIKKSINSIDKIAIDAKFKLNQLIVDNVKAIKADDTEELPIAKSVNSIVTGKSTKNLDKDFVNMYEEYCGFSVEDEK